LSLWILLLIAAKRDKEAANDVAAKIRIEKIGAAQPDGESVKIRMEKLLIYNCILSHFKFFSL
jgi:hypothetical protein